MEGAGCWLGDGGGWLMEAHTVSCLPLCDVGSVPRSPCLPLWCQPLRTLRHRSPLIGAAQPQRIQLAALTDHITSLRQANPSHSSSRGFRLVREDATSLVA
ncbi:hypothetical protein FKM82_010320, partial [Ascaphus truei]